MPTPRALQDALDSAPDDVRQTLEWLQREAFALRSHRGGAHALFGNLRLEFERADTAVQVHHERGQWMVAIGPSGRPPRFRDLAVVLAAMSGDAPKLPSQGVGQRVAEQLPEDVRWRTQVPAAIEWLENADRSAAIEIAYGQSIRASIESYRPSQASRAPDAAADLIATEGGASLAELRDRLEAVCRACLAPDGVELVLRLARPAIGFRRTDRDTGSHVGGAARLVRSAIWPEWRGRSLALVALIDLAEIAQFETDVALPEVGLLNFFYDAEEQEAWGFDPSHREGWRVILVDPSEAVATARPSDTVAFSNIGLTPTQTLTVPGWEEAAVEPIFPAHHLRRDEHHEMRRQAYFAMLDDWREITGWTSATNHQIGGWPRLVQGPIWRDCDVVSQGFPLGSPEQAADPRLARLQQRPDDWQLLLQLDSDDEAGWSWGSDGTSYYAVRRSLPAPMSFDQAWMILQCA